MATTLKTALRTYGSVAQRLTQEAEALLNAQMTLEQLLNGLPAVIRGDPLLAEWSDSVLADSQHVSVLMGSLYTSIRLARTLAYRLGLEPDTGERVD